MSRSRYPVNGTWHPFHMPHDTTHQRSYGIDGAFMSFHIKKPTELVIHTISHIHSLILTDYLTYVIVTLALYIKTNI